ncbi:MAG: hypothetical protein HY361_02315 [Candidatus Aenigmarchaeota archaeon]|nr:hypothetical protein [Candidatus Aenigmarchaeota archaeon]
MKGQIAIILMLLFLITAVLIFLAVSIIFVPILKTIVVTPILEPPAVAVITALFGFLPDQCSVLTSLDCRFCFITQKLLPLVVNTVFGIILFSIILRPLFGKDRLLDWQGGLSKGPLEYYSAVLLISLAFSIFMLHQPAPLLLLNWMTMILAIAVRIIAFMVAGETIDDLRRLTDFFLAANILVSGWTNLWIFAIVFIAGFTFVSAIQERGPRAGQPRMHFTRGNLLIFSVLLLLLGGYLYMVFEHQWWTPIGTLPTKIEFHGLASYITEKANLPEITCGENTIGPESSISL